MTDVMAEFGVAREIQLIANKRIFDDMVKRSIERHFLTQRAKIIEKSFPASGGLLQQRIENWNKFCAGLKPKEVPDTDEEF